MNKELNNPAPDSIEEKSEKGTELDKGKEKEEVTLPEKFKGSKNPLKDVLKAYNELESHLGERDKTDTQMRDRLAKLEGMMENQKKEPVPQITPEEKKQMEERFKGDFNIDPLNALHSFVAPYVQDARAAREDVVALRKEFREREEDKRKAVDLMETARKEDPEGFDELEPQIEKELRENETWGKFENPYTAAFYHVKGKSIKKLPRASDAERESHVEGSSSEPPKTDEKKAYVKKIVDAKINTRL